MVLERTLKDCLIHKGNDDMRVLRGLGFGTITGAGAGVATALLIAVSLGIASLFDGQMPVDERLGTALVAVFLVGAYGVVIGAVVGAVLGAALGSILGAGGWEQQARWVASSVLLMVVGVIASLATNGRPDPTAMLIAGGSAITLGAVGYVAGIVFERMAAVRTAPIQIPEASVDGVLVG